MTGRLLIGVSLMMCACSAELDPVATTAESSHPLEGSWRIESRLTGDTCPEFDLFGPVDTTAVSIHRQGDGWLMDGREGSMRFDEVATDQWLGRLSVPYEGCTLEAESEWDFEAVGPTSFAGWRTTTFRVRGGDCGTAAQACTVTHALRGVR